LRGHARARHASAQVPNLITFANLLCGVAAIMLATQRHFAVATGAIFTAGALDLLDGALARRLRGFDAFGEALDSLADIISFGVAPGLLIYEAFLHPWPVLGWVVAGGYVVCGAWRLARFASDAKGPYFRGLPITMAGMSAAALLFYRDFWSPRLVALLTLGLAVLMVSHLRFPKFPAIAGRLPRPAQLLALLFLLAASLLVPLSTVIVALGLSYYVGSLLENLGFWEAVADGPVGDVVERLRARL
jgi:CDP-diacylglycerol--serine O-phosphatidyltransferase